MNKLSKNRKVLITKIQKDKNYPISEALDLLKEISFTKFVESVDISINLGIDAKKSDQNVRGAVVLPHGTGKSVRVAVFTQGDNVAKAEAAGADIVGMDDLMESMKGGDLDYDVVIASPDAMGVVGRLGQILGPKGLMPNPKVGTVAMDVAQAVTNAKSGQAKYRNDKAGVVHSLVGKLDFDTNALIENINTLLAAVKKAKPTNAKGIYLKKITVSSTMGAGLTVDMSSLVV